MGAHFHRHTRRRNTTADVESAFEADIPSRERQQFNTPRVARVPGCACPAKQRKEPTRGTLAIVGLLQNRSIHWWIGPERV